MINQLKTDQELMRFNYFNVALLATAAVSTANAVTLSSSEQDHNDQVARLISLTMIDNGDQNGDGERGNYLTEPFLALHSAVIHRIAEIMDWGDENTEALLTVLMNYGYSGEGTGASY